MIRIPRGAIGVTAGLAIMVLGALAVLWLPIAGSSRRQEDTLPARLPAVSTALLQPQVWTESFRAYGVVRPVEEVELTTDFAATVISVHFDEGQKVETGAVLIEFDPGKRQLRLDQAEAVVTQARARLGKARSDMDRATALRKQNVLPLAEYDALEAEVRSAEGFLTEALAARQLVQREVEESTLVSPVSGLVALRSVEPGERVMPGQLLGKIQVVDTVRAVTYVSERDVNALRVGGEARVTATGVPARQYRARIESIGSSADSRTGNFPIKLTVGNEDGLLRDGMTARVFLQGTQLEQALLIPPEAVVHRYQRRVVYKLVKDRAVEVEPSLVLTSGQDYLVLDGLTAGDEIIVGGLGSVVDGAQVVPVRESEA